MERAAKLTGFAAAHAIWSISDGEVLVTMLMHEDTSGARGLDRLVLPRIEESVAHGRELLTKNEAAYARAALVYDGYVTLPSGKTDAILVEAREYSDAALKFEIAIPYRSAKSSEGFAVYRAKLLSLPPGMDACASTLVEAFGNGIASHAKAAPIWEKYLVESR